MTAISGEPATRPAPEKAASREGAAREKFHALRLRFRIDMKTRQKSVNRIHTNELCGSG